MMKQYTMTDFIHRVLSVRPEIIDILCSSLWPFGGGERKKRLIVFIKTVDEIKVTVAFFLLRLLEE